MPRPLPTDIPSNKPTTRAAVIRAALNESTYSLDFGGQGLPEIGVYAGSSTLPVGKRVQCVWHPERRHWEILTLGEVVTDCSITMVDLADPGLSVFENFGALGHTPDGKWWFTGANSTTDFIQVWEFDDQLEIFILSQNFNTGITNLVARQFGVHPDATYVAVGLSTTPFTRVYPFDDVTGQLSAAVSNPAVLPGARTWTPRWLSDGSALIMGCDSATDPVVGYEWSAGYGTKFSTPADVTGFTNIDNTSIAIHPDDNAVVVCRQFTIVTAYALTPTAFGARFSGDWVDNDSNFPSNFPAGPYIPDCPQFNFDGSLLAFAHDGFGTSPSAVLTDWDDVTGLGDPVFAPSYGFFLPDRWVIGWHPTESKLALGWAPNDYVLGESSLLVFDLTGGLTFPTTFQQTCHYMLTINEMYDDFDFSLTETSSSLWHPNGIHIIAEGFEQLCAFRYTAGSDPAGDTAPLNSDEVLYVPTTPADWDATPPVTVLEALDRLAAVAGSPP